MSQPTIATVAQVAGVSKSTVSRVLNGNVRHMRSETRDRVLQTIEDLGYRPSSIARSLTSKRSFTAAIVISDVRNPFYPDVIHGVEEIALASSYNIFLCNTNYDLERGTTMVRSLVDKQVDGVLIMSSNMSDEWIVELSRHNIAVVVLDWDTQNINEDVGTISVDFAPGIRDAVDHLIELGHRRFAHVSGSLDLKTARTRRDLFFDALAVYGIESKDVMIIEGDLRIEAGRKAVSLLVRKPHPPTVVFCANDLMAIGVIRAAREQGLVIPQDLSVVGLDNIWLASEMEPPLTTVALPRREIGNIAMKMLLELLEDAQEPSPRAATVRSFLVVRQSTSPPATDRQPA